MALKLSNNPKQKYLFSSLAGMFTADGKGTLPFSNGFAYAGEALGVTSLFDLASVLGVRMALVSDARRRNSFPLLWIQTINSLTALQEKIMDDKEFLQAAAAVIEKQLFANDGIAIPADPDVAEFMGAFEDSALDEGFDGGSDGDLI